MHDDVIFSQLALMCSSFTFLNKGGNECPDDVFCVLHPTTTTVDYHCSVYIGLLLTIT